MQRMGWAAVCVWAGMVSGAHAGTLALEDDVGGAVRITTDQEDEVIGAEWENPAVFAVPCSSAKVSANGDFSHLVGSTEVIGGKTTLFKANYGRTGIGRLCPATTVQIEFCKTRAVTVPGAVFCRMVAPVPRAAFVEPPAAPAATEPEPAPKPPEPAPLPAQVMKIASTTGARASISVQQFDDKGRFPTDVIVTFDKEPKGDCDVVRATSASNSMGTTWQAQRDGRTVTVHTTQPQLAFGLDEPVTLSVCDQVFKLKAIEYRWLLSTEPNQPPIPPMPKRLRDAVSVYDSTCEMDKVDYSEAVVVSLRVQNKAPERLVGAMYRISVKNPLGATLLDQAFSTDVPVNALSRDHGIIGWVFKDNQFRGGEPYDKMHQVCGYGTARITVTPVKAVFDDGTVLSR